MGALLGMDLVSADVSFFRRGDLHRYPTRPTIDLGYPGECELQDGAYIDEPLDSKRACDKPEQVGASLIGPAFGESYTLRTCMCNAVNALAKRHLAKPKYAATRTLHWPRNLARIVKSYYYDEFRTERRRWLDKWPASKRAAILRSERDDPLIRGKVKLMVKRESQHKPPSKARGIQMYRNLRTQAIAGWRHTAMQRAIKRATEQPFEVFPGIFIQATSGWSATKFVEWAVRHASADWFFESDASNFDASVRAAITRGRARWSWLIDPELARDIFDNVKFSGRYFGGATFRYGGEGTVKSGHNDTTWGNTLANALVAADALRCAGVRGNIIAAGDDLLVAVYGRECAAELAGTIRAHGFDPKYVAWSHLADATFVSSGFLHDGANWWFAPLPLRLLKRMWWTTSPPPLRRLAERRSGDAMGVLATHAGNPIFEAFLRPDVRDSRANPHWRPGGRAPEGFDYMAAYAVGYSCTRSELERALRIISDHRSASVLESEVLDSLFARDLLDAYERAPGWGRRLAASN